MFVEFMKEEIIKSAKLNSLSPPFLPAHKGGLAPCIWDNGVIISHSARPAARSQCIIQAAQRKTPNPDPHPLPLAPASLSLPLASPPPAAGPAPWGHGLQHRTSSRMAPQGFSAMQNWARASVVSDAFPLPRLGTHPKGGKPTRRPLFPAAPFTGPKGGSNPAVHGVDEGTH